MTKRVLVSGLNVAKVLHDFVNREALPGTGVSETTFWTRVDQIVRDLTPKSRALLEVRDEMQGKIDGWHKARKGQPFDPVAYKGMLAEIGYLLPEGPDFAVDTTAVDAEIGSIAGPQLVVPVTNARYALTPPTHAGAASTTPCTAPTCCPRMTGQRVAAATIPCAAPRYSPGPSASSTRWRRLPRARMPR